MIGVLAVLPNDPATLTLYQWGALFTALLFFMYPANLFFYGLNDLSDRETDSYNSRKDHDPDYVQALEHPGLIHGLIWFVCLPLIGVMALLNQDILVHLFLFLVFGMSYSVAPIRLKARPFFDSLSTVHYLIPAYVGATIVSGELLFPAGVYLIIGWLTAVALHAFYATLDIRPDNAAGIGTIAVFLGQSTTLLVSSIALLMAASFSFVVIPWYVSLWGLALWGLYVYSIFTVDADEPADMLRIGQWIPVAVTGYCMIICLWILLERL